MTRSPHPGEADSLGYNPWCNMPKQLNPEYEWGDFRMIERFALPYVSGEVKEVNDPDTYDDTVDVYVEQCGKNLPGANLVFSPGGPSSFYLLGWSTDQLRLFATYLVDAANALDQHVAASDT